MVAGFTWGAITSVRPFFTFMCMDQFLWAGSVRYYYTHLTAPFPGDPVPERQRIILDFNEARDVM